VAVKRSRLTPSLTAFSKSVDFSKAQKRQALPQLNINRLLNGGAVEGILEQQERSFKLTDGD